MSLSTKTVESPVGRLQLVASRDRLLAVLWSSEKPSLTGESLRSEGPVHPILLETERQLREYFAGKRESFSVPIEMRGTAFQRSVWESLLEIPFGQTRTYGQLAQRLGNPQAVRAVGAANGRNPLSIIVPCHRVIGASGKLTGFAGGLQAKASLLELEARFVARPESTEDPPLFALASPSA